MMSSLAATRPQRDPLVAPGKIEHHAADMAVTVAADVTLDKLQKRLAKSRQWAALDGDPSRSLGWLMQHDSTGPLRLGFGGWRDLLTGVQFTDGYGELVTVGGLTVKNVAGYDLVKFMVGSHGCFGTPISLTLRTYSVPEAALAATLSASLDQVRALLESDAPPQWLLWTWQGLRAGWLGLEREMLAIEQPLASLLGVEPERRTLEADLAERRRLLEVGAELVRTCVAPTQIPGLLAELGDSSVVADPVFGVVWMPMTETFSRVREIVSRHGGDALWLGRDGARSYGLGASTTAVLRILKQKMDPEGRVPALPL